MKDAYTDCKLRVGFFAATDANQIGWVSPDDVNIQHIRPDRKYGTGLNSTVGGPIKWRKVQVRTLQAAYPRQCATSWPSAIP